MKLYTIGFTKRSAEDFFGTISRSGPSRVVDVRLNNSSQLAAFSKRDDLRYFLKLICGVGYLHLPQFAPTPELLDEYRSTKDWPSYEAKFRSLLAERQVEKSIATHELDGACLLCSEPKPDKCHRRVVAEYLRDKWGRIEIVHL